MVQRKIPKYHKQIIQIYAVDLRPAKKEYQQLTSVDQVVNFISGRKSDEEIQEIITDCQKKFNDEFPDATISHYFIENNKHYFNCDNYDCNCSHDNIIPDKYNLTIVGYVKMSDEEIKRLKASEERQKKASEREKLKRERLAEKRKAADEARLKKQYEILKKKFEQIE